MGRAEAGQRQRQRQRQVGQGRQAGRRKQAGSLVLESEMAPRSARETKRGWSINVKREGRVVWLLIARGATSARMGPATAFGHWSRRSRSHRRTLPLPAVPASRASLPASQRALGQCGPVELDGVVIQSSHVQINPKQSGSEMPRFGRAADETSQAGPGWKGTGQHSAAQRSAAHDTHDTARRVLISTGHVVACRAGRVGCPAWRLCCSPSSVLCPLSSAPSGTRAPGRRGNWPGWADELPTGFPRPLRIKPPAPALVAR